MPPNGARPPRKLPIDGPGPMAHGWRDSMGVWERTWDEGRVLGVAIPGGANEVAGNTSPRRHKQAFMRVAPEWAKDRSAPGIRSGEWLSRSAPRSALQLRRAPQRSVSGLQRVLWSAPSVERSWRALQGALPPPGALAEKSAKEPRSHEALPRNAPAALDYGALPERSKRPSRFPLATS
jgi:hypothetical protein